MTTFLLALVGHAGAGHAEFNNQLITEGMAPISFGAYVSSSDFAVDVTENWQSEYLQFFLYILATVWLLQRGSPESKELDKAGTESDKDQMAGEHATKESSRWAAATDWRGFAYSNSSYASFKRPAPGPNTCPLRTSGAAHCRTGSPSCWPSPPWPFWPFT